MHVLIVHVHPEPKSFNAALTERARQVLTENGHEVVISDLYAQKFNPVAGPWDVTERMDPEFFQLGLRARPRRRAQSICQRHSTRDRKSAQSRLSDPAVPHVVVFDPRHLERLG